ncbi:transposase [Planomonospora sphaerica]|uniref:Transposase n=2 Tax=Planomonospora sphaerica TaxID=161355 RepID=A0A171DJU3_9ACTN|nr:transposase [Planomonospora sphaerica]
MRECRAWNQSVAMSVSVIRPINAKAELTLRLHRAQQRRRRRTCVPVPVPLRRLRPLRTDVSYLPDLETYLADLLRSREKLPATVEVDDWTRAEAMPSDEQISRVRRLISRIKADVDDLAEEEKAQIMEVVTIVRRHRQGIVTIVRRHRQGIVTIVRRHRQGIVTIVRRHRQGIVTLGMSAVRQPLPDVRPDRSA